MVNLNKKSVGGSSVRSIDKKDLIAEAKAFYIEHHRPPKLKELSRWRTITRMYEEAGGIKQFLTEAGMLTHEEWLREQRIKALGYVLDHYGELTRSEYQKLYSENKEDPAEGLKHLPSVHTVKRMFNNISQFGQGQHGLVWRMARSEYEDYKSKDK